MDFKWLPHCDTTYGKNMGFDEFCMTLNVNGNL